MKMTEQIDPEKYLNKQNRDLYEKVSSSFSIELLKIINSDDIPDNSLWQLYFQEDTLQIIHYEDSKNNSSFTHELLHAEIIIDGFTDTSIFIKDHLLNDEFLKMLLIGSIGQMQNVFAHFKMFPLFVDRNFPKEEFTSDFHQTPNIQGCIDIINERFEDRNIPNTSIDAYIKAFYTSKDNRNKLNAPHFKTLEDFLIKKNESLFNLLQNNWNKWIKDPSYNNKVYIEELLLQISKWYTEKGNVN